MGEQTEILAAGEVGPRHPLDPLSSGEIERACRCVRRARDWGEGLKFAGVHLLEPEPAQLRAWGEGARPLRRRAFLVVIARASGEAWEAIVDLGADAVEQWRQLLSDDTPYGQPPVLIEDAARCEAIVKADAAWRRAMERRGLSNDEIALVQVDAFSAGYFGREVEAGRRLVRAVCYYREALTDNAYARPIEGVVALVDLHHEAIVELVDADPIVPIPKKKRNYDTASLGPARQDVKPLHIVQPDGPGFVVDGWSVRWQDWRFRVGFTPREGLVLHQLAFSDAGEARSVIHRASVTEMVVPYADPTPNHFWKSAFDAGEYGLGKMANQLELGCDCLGLIHYFDIPTADEDGQPAVMRNAVCMHEEDYGILWKHYEVRTGVFEVRRSRRLVISFFATVGNYDYGFYWYLYQDGTIQLEAKLTGIIQTAAIAPGATYPWGGMVDENLGGPTHQHFFSARLHMAVDGPTNSITEHEFQPRPWSADNPHGNVFDLVSRPLRRELDAAREADGATGRYWKIINPDRTNSVGGRPGYKLVVTPTPLMLAQEGSFVRRRGEFATKHLWVTPYAPEERYASGDYPNQHAGGDGVSAWVRQNRAIENAELVVWHTFGHTHVCKPEDFPVMPVEYAGFMLKPNGFFAANPAIDLPPAPDHASAYAGPQAEAQSSCCSSGP